MDAWADDTTPPPLKLIYYCDPKDKKYGDELDKNLRLLRQERLLTTWSNLELRVGQKPKKAINARLEDADIVVLLISPDFLASEYSNDILLKQALAMDDAELAQVIPLLVRPSDWQNTPLRKQLPIPRNGLPVSRWKDQDEAWVNVVKEIRSAAGGIRTKLIQKHEAARAAAIPPALDEPSSLNQERESEAAQVFAISSVSDQPSSRVARGRSLKSLLRHPSLRLALIALVVLGSLLGYGVSRVVSNGTGSQLVSFCDRNCVIDTDTLNASLKSEASAAQQAHNDTVACSDWYLAMREDATDGEARIAFQNYDMQYDPTDYSHNPCGDQRTVGQVINIAVVVQPVPNNRLLNSYTQAILQAIALRQQEFDDDHHSAGLVLHIYLLNLGDGSDRAQVNAAQQLKKATTGNDAIAGVVLGLPYGVETLIQALGDDNIPTISVASVDASPAMYRPYFLSVSPSLQAQADATLHVIEVTASPSAQVAIFYNDGDQYTYNGGDQYNHQLAQLFYGELIKSNSYNSHVYTAYEDTGTLSQYALADIKNNPHISLIYLAGLPDDALQLQAALAANYPAVQVLGSDSMYQWVYQNYSPEQMVMALNLQFLSFAYHSFGSIEDSNDIAYSQCRIAPDTRKQLVFDSYDVTSDYKNDFDPPGSIYLGSAYMHDVASSDTLLAYDAVSLLDVAASSLLSTPGHVLSIQTMWQELQQFTPQHPFPGVTGQLSYRTDQSAPYEKAVLALTIQPMQINTDNTDNTVKGNVSNSMMDIPGTEANVWDGCYTLSTDA